MATISKRDAPDRTRSAVGRSGGTSRGGSRQRPDLLSLLGNAAVQRLLHPASSAQPGGVRLQRQDDIPPPPRIFPHWSEWYFDVAETMSELYALTSKDYLERAFYVMWNENTKSSFPGPTVLGGENEVDPGRLPIDKPPLFPVGVFHTHPPPRPGYVRNKVGPSGRDQKFSEAAQLPGAVTDLARPGTSDPKQSAVFFLGPGRRPETLPQQPLPPFNSPPLMMRPQPRFERHPALQAQLTPHTPGQIGQIARQAESQPGQKDALVAETIKAELERFRNISIDLTVSPKAAGGQVVQGPPRLVTVTVQATYFINTRTAQIHFKAARKDFRKIKRALRGESSLIEVGGSKINAGRAVELGKATPEDVKKFVEEAIRQGVVKQFALKEKLLDKGKDLVDLAPEALEEAIQRWMYHSGVGVDCSGFVLQALIKAREAVRGEILKAGAAAALPPEVAHGERDAASFKSEPKVKTPAELHPGDVWVVSAGGHIRIITDVRVLDDGVEIDTAESAGGSKKSSPGPVHRTWKIGSTSTFKSIKPLGHKGGAVKGSFHRLAGN